MDQRTQFIAVLLGESHDGVSSYRKELIRVRGIGGADPEVLRHYFTA